MRPLARLSVEDWWSRKQDQHHFSCSLQLTKLFLQTWLLIFCLMRFWKFFIWKWFGKLFIFSHFFDKNKKHKFELFGHPPSENNNNTLKPKPTQTLKTDSSTTLCLVQYVGVKKVGGPFFYLMASQPLHHVIVVAATAAFLPNTWRANILGTVGTHLSE